MTTPTTRRHPRTESEAFKGPDYASAFDGCDPFAPRSGNLNGWRGVALAVAIGLVGAWVMVAWAVQ